MAPPYEDEPPQSSGLPQIALPRLTKVVRRLIIVNVVVAALCFVLWFTNAERYVELRDLLGLDTARWTSAFPLEPVWQLLTYGFLHAPNNPWHIVGNMLILYFFGTMLEERLGGRRFFLTYLTAQLVGALFFLAPAVFGLRDGIAIGASGAVFGVMIAVATLYPTQVAYFLLIPLRLKWIAIGIVGLELYATLVDLKQGPDGTAHLIHLGGAAYGFLAVKFGLIEKDPIQILERKRAVHQVAREADDEVRMDRLLEKIHREGMGSLSRSEKDFLRRMSSKR